MEVQSLASTSQLNSRATTDTNVPPRPMNRLILRLPHLQKQVEIEWEITILLLVSDIKTFVLDKYQIPLKKQMIYIEDTMCMDNDKVIADNTTLTMLELLPVKVIYFPSEKEVCRLEVDVAVDKKASELIKEALETFVLLPKGTYVLEDICMKHVLAPDEKLIDTIPFRGEYVLYQKNIKPASENTENSN